MNVEEMIKNFIPSNEQEVKDKEMFLYYQDCFDDVLTRNNEVAHLTSSAFVVNETRDKALMIYHNIYNSWAWTGGHADGDSDLLEVAIREAKEETGIANVKPIINDIFTIDILPVLGHEKRGKYVSAHVHLSVAYLLEGNDNEKLFIKADENSNVKWIPLDQVVKYSTEPHMKPVYEKIINKIKGFKI